jgi:hypothetical protein
MTRPIVFRAVTWRGEGPGPWSFTAVPPAGFEQYRVTGSLRATTDSHLQDLELVTVNDPETGAQVAIRGDDATITLSGDADPKYVNRLWRDARHLAGLAQRIGRPPGSTIITSDEQIRAVVLQMRRDRRKVTEDTVATFAGTFSKANLRHYLTATGRTWRELLRTF